MRGFTLIEVMVAMLIMAIVLLFGMSFFSIARQPFSLAQHTSYALQIAENDLEELKAGSFSGVVSMGATAKVDPASGLTFTLIRTMTPISAVARTVEAKVSWTEPNSGSRSVVLRTVLASPFPATN